MGGIKIEGPLYSLVSVTVHKRSHSYSIAMLTGQTEDNTNLSSFFPRTFMSSQQALISSVVCICFAIPGSSNIICRESIIIISEYYLQVIYMYTMIISKPYKYKF